MEYKINLYFLITNNNNNKNDNNIDINVVCFLQFVIKCVMIQMAVRVVRVEAVWCVEARPLDLSPACRVFPHNKAALKGQTASWLCTETQSDLQDEEGGGHIVTVSLQWSKNREALPCFHCVSVRAEAVGVIYIKQIIIQACAKQILRQIFSERWGQN